MRQRRCIFELGKGFFSLSRAVALFLSGGLRGRQLCYFSPLFKLTSEFISYFSSSTSSAEKTPEQCRHVNFPRCMLNKFTPSVFVNCLKMNGFDHKIKSNIPLRQSFLTSDFPRLVFRHGCLNFKIFPGWGW